MHHQPIPEPTQLHALGLAGNYSPKRQRPVKEFDRVWPNVRKVLLRKPGALWLWVTRDLAQSRRSGGKWFMRGDLQAAYPGWFVALGERALVVLTGGVK